MQTLPTDPTATATGTDDDKPRTAMVPWWLAAVAGVTAAGAALAVAELLAGLAARIPSLIDAVADLVVENGFEELDDFSRSTFGTGQKTALLTGIPLSCLALGAVIGVLARKRRSVGVAAFAAFGVVGAYATWSDELASTGWGIVAAVVAAAVGAAALTGLLSAAQHRAGGADDTGVGAMAGFMAERRRFVAAGGSLALGSIFAGWLGTFLQNRRSVEGDRAEVAESIGSGDVAVDGGSTAVPADVATFDDLDGLADLITPNDDFYLIDTAVSKPLLDIDSWRLKVTGMVDQEVEFTFSDLLDMDVVEAPVTLSCVSNQVGGDLVGNAIWRGVRLTDVLDRAGVDPATATQLVGRSADGWTAGFPTELAFDGRTALVAFAMNDEPLPVEHGFPARLVVAGLYGYVSATKWLTEIELTTWEAFDAFWVPRGWAKEGPIKTQSRIDVPRNRAEVPAGLTAVAGVAWAPDRSVDRVEVRIDGGNWVEASLSGELSEDSWRQWLYEWDAPAGDHTIEVRATDGTGEPQTAEEAPPRPDGATGYHSIDVAVI